MVQKIMHIGIDLIDVNKVKSLLLCHDAATLGYLFSEEEKAYCERQQDIPAFALSFSGKEAVSKALGFGMKAFNWFEVSIFPAKDHTFSVALSGDAMSLAQTLEAVHWQGSWDILDNGLYVTSVIATKERK